jgi:hypothetical protein
MTTPFLPADHTLQSPSDHPSIQFHVGIGTSSSRNFWSFNFLPLTFFPFFFTTTLLTRSRHHATKTNKAEQAGSPKLQLATSKDILKQRTLLESSKLKKPANDPLITAMDMDDNDWPLLNASTDTTMEIQEMAPDPTTPHIKDADGNTMVTTPSEPPKAITPAPKESTRKSVVFDATNTDDTFYQSLTSSGE